MNEQELEERIWNFASVPINKTKLWQKVGGHKKTCFDKIDDMVETSRLKKTKHGNADLIVRLDAIKESEFQFGFTFQVNMLESSRIAISKFKKPMFKRRKATMTTTSSSGLYPDGVAFGTLVSNYIPKSKVIIQNLDNMNFYHNALLLFISRANLQRSLGLISKSVAEKRIKKCENALEYHFKKLFSENPRDTKAIREVYQNLVFRIEGFRI